MKFILTIDTEGDNQWDHGRTLSVDNIRYLPRLQELCEKFEIVPTYLVTTEVCEDEYAQEFLGGVAQAGLAEIGGHLHSWTTPPFADEDGLRFNDPNHCFANELDKKMLELKIQTLTNQIYAGFGVQPVSFRSGRYGFNDVVAEVLKAAGYLVDSSVTPFRTWKKNKGKPGGEGGPDFMNQSPWPFKITTEAGTLLEIPITILPTRFPLSHNHTLSRYFFSHCEKSFPLKVIRKVFFPDQPLWLRPYKWMKQVDFTAVLDEAIRLKLPYLVMMFHSSELMPGCSIYRKDEAEVNLLYTQLEEFFRLLQKKNIRSCTLGSTVINVSR